MPPARHPDVDAKELRAVVSGSASTAAAHLDSKVCLASLAELERDVSAWNVGPAEELGRDEAWAAAVPEGVAAVHRAKTVFRGLVEASEADPDAVELGDLAFVAALEAKRMQEQLAGLDREPSKWRLLEVCHRVRRRLLRGITATTRELQRLQGVESVSESFVEELARSLRCRAALARFWHRVESTRGEERLRRLRLVGTSVAMLQGHPGFRELRLGDRRVLRELQERLLRWLRSPERSSTEGERLIQDLEGFISLSRRINERMELVEHDVVLGARLVEQLELLGDASVPEDVLPRLRHLVGWSREVDALLYASETPTSGAVVACLRRRHPDLGASPRAGSITEFERAWARVPAPRTDKR